MVGAVNALGGRWAETAEAAGASTVYSPVGVWPLLGLLAAGAAARPGGAPPDGQGGHGRSGRAAWRPTTTAAKASA
ncbi:hypothetical protein [Streptomyces sp. CBMA123]|uniref:hypothetical protein n=1 Tax=Streptomyces sp. CBMA123 TaxID=1896313 RepID=UPI001661ADDF|nr:hypothetical protein [Streptomyces sp. CBMA123]MBD0695797.1 hypothetical protein [Streptomyces sp. CBMA123]